MSQPARALAVPVISRQNLHRLETHFIAPDVYRRDDVAHRQAQLARLVSTSIVPRLLHLHTEVVADALPFCELMEALAPSSTDVSALADIVLGADLEAAAAYVMVLREKGLSLDSLFVELLEPTARCLGEMWDRDECDFIDVTLGVGRLQQLLAVFNDTHTVPGLDTDRQVLMAMTPGNQHSFGIKMVARFLLAAAWQVKTELSGNVEDIVANVRDGWFAVVGLTAGSDRQIESLTSTIAAIRKHSRNKAIGIMVGGPMFIANPELAHEVGADATAPDAPTAVLVAQKLYDLAQLAARAAA
jgi:MerR family transcriptional regulator, light-induced transcriptional regulator